MLKYYEEKKKSASAQCLRLAANLQYARDHTLKEQFKESKNEYNYYCYKVKEAEYSLQRNRANTAPINEMLAVFVASANQLYPRDPVLARSLATIGLHLQAENYKQAHDKLECIVAGQYRDILDENCIYFVQLAWPKAKHTFLKILQKRV